MKTIEDLNLLNKTVLLRSDYNVPTNGKIITDDTRIRKSLKTINYLLQKNCKIIILSHFGRIKSEDDKNKYDLNIVANKLSELTNKKVIFINNCYHKDIKEVINKYPLGTIILLQNTRYMDLYEKAESKNNIDLAKYWASLGDVYINDAFASSHRLHASVAGITKYLPSGIGFLIKEEIEGLKPLIELNERPFTVFMGGAKVEDKLPIIKKILPKCDYLLLGGGILNSFVKAKGEDIKESLATSDTDTINELKELLTTYQHKIIMSDDYITKDNKILDITLEDYKEYINKSKLIFVNGAPGLFEDHEFENGTKELLDCLKNSRAKVILGGGDTINAINKFGYNNDFYFISSGGGATLEYIADSSLKALEWIEK